MKYRFFEPKGMSPKFEKKYDTLGSIHFITVYMLSKQIQPGY